MERYRKADQFYIDEYDRRTIKLLKELEVQEAVRRGNVKTLEEKIRLTVEESASLNSFFHNAVMRARHREDYIRSSIQRDESYDRLVAKYPVPQNIKCKTCDTNMNLCNHFFKEGDAELLFVFECPNGHAPRRAVYPSGREFYFPISRCKKCNAELKSKTKRTKKKLTLSTFCTRCDFKEVDEIDLSKRQDESINEEDRQKYCTSFISRRTFWEDFEEVANFVKAFEESNKQKLEKEGYDLDAVKRIKIPQLEQRISELIETKGYIKLSFEKPVFTKYAVITFSVQDPTERTEKESIKQLQRLLIPNLFLTNWRLVKTDLSYRMGYITGKLKGFEQDDDVLKLAKEIHEKQKAVDN